MVNVIKDERQWKVVHEFDNGTCPFLYYPANYHGCKLLDEQDNLSTLENCPRKREVETMPKRKDITK